MGQARLTTLSAHHGEPGKRADFTVLSQDILKIPEAEIPKTTCRMTIVNGEIAYRATETHPAIAQQ